MAFKKGEKRPANAGRRAGIPNKATAEIKDMLREALDNKGGVKYFEKHADSNPTAFMTLIGKIIPADVNAKLSGTVNVTWPLARTKLDE